MTSADVRRALDGVADTVSVRNGVYTARRGFYYTHGRTADALADAVRRAIPGATVTGSGEHWAPFRGGQSVRDGSHWFVSFTVG